MPFLMQPTHCGLSNCLKSTPPEIPKPSKISEAFQEVVTTELLKMVPEAFIVSGPRHHCSSKISENQAFPRATQSVKGLFGATNSATPPRQVAMPPIGDI